MVNVNPRRKPPPALPRARKKGAAQWSKGDPTRSFGLNVPIPEPLMLQLDYLVEQRIIFSKASFIRELLARACEDEIAKYQRLQQRLSKLKD